MFNSTEKIGKINEVVITEQLLVAKLIQAFFPIIQVIDPINKLLETVTFDVYCYSLDWHPDDHLSFVDNVHDRKLHESSPVRKNISYYYYIMRVKTI